MGFKDRIRKIGNSTKQFFKDNWDKIALAGVGLGLTAAGCYAYYKVEKNSWEEYKKLQESIVSEEAIKTMIEESASNREHEWKKELDDDWGFLERATRQVEHLNGYSWIIAGPDSFYNENPETVEFYVVDNEGYYTRKPDDNDGMQP